MSAAYDNYDYNAYWDNRSYEHESEVVAIRSFLNQIPTINKIVDIGAGFGRLTPDYAFRAKSVTLTEPSSKLLAIARKNLSENKKINFVQSKIENLNDKFRNGSFDLAIMVRVAHHIKDLDMTFNSVSKLLTPSGYFIFEFANKIHAKALITNLAHGNLSYLTDVSPQDKSTHKEKTLPFLNYHPKLVSEKLQKAGFKILEKRSVSNIRSPFLKKHIPISMLISLESKLQTSLSVINFGPSIFVLAKKME